MMEPVTGDIATTTTAVADTIAVTSSWITVYVIPVLIAIAAGIIAWCTKGLVSYLKTKPFYTEAKPEEKEIYDLLFAGVMSNQPLVTALKDAAADGKLTADEITRLKIKAIEYAKSIASPIAKEKLLACGRAKLEEYIETILANIKK